MLPKLNQTARRRVLQDLGLEVWRLRLGAAAPRETAVPTITADAVPAAPARSSGRSVADPARRVNPPAAPADPSAVAPPSATAAAVAADAGAGADPVHETFEVTSLAAAGVLLLLDGPLSGRDRRLALDLLAAASGVWNQRPASRRFAWPPVPGIAGVGADAAGRALRAFLDKDLQDHGAHLLICAAALIERLAGRPGCAVLEIPPLDALSRNPTDKRRVWRELARHRAARPAPGAGEGDGDG